MHLRLLLKMVIVAALSMRLTANDDLPWRQSAELRLPPAFTTVFSFDDSTFGLLDPVKAEIRVVSGEGVERRTIRLGGAVASTAGSIYPDVVQRGPDGRIYWLKKRIALILVYSMDGTLERTVGTHLPSPFWFQVERNGNILIHGTSEFAPTAQYVSVDRAGKLLHVGAAWLPPAKNKNHFARQFFFGEGANQVELLAHFPLLRRNSRSVVDFSGCSAFPAAVATALRGQSMKFKLAVAKVFEADHSEYPVILGAAPAGTNAVYALGNGSVLLRFRSGPPECWRIPPPRGEKMYYPTSIAIAGARLGVLTSLDGQVKVFRIWDLGTDR